MAVIPDAEESHFKRQMRGQAALRGFPHPVDLLVYTQAEWDSLAPNRYSVARQVKETGIVLQAA